MTWKLDRCTNFEKFLLTFQHSIEDSTFVFSNGGFYNVPINDLVEIIDHALANGYTAEIDCDVSEKTFSAKDGIAVIPANKLNNLKALHSIYPEMDVTQEYRQQEFENFKTNS